MRFAWLVVMLAVSLPAHAQTPEALGEYRDWSAWRVGSGKKAECFIHARPAKSEGKYTRRDEVSFAVTRRPADKVVNEVSITAGYTYRKESEVKLLVDDKVFRLFSDGDMAFARDSKTDATLVEAMKKGTRLVVQGISSKGTQTVDTYSLRGFTAAHRAIERACPRSS